jgi:cytoskeleton protein RodZ
MSAADNKNEHETRQTGIGPGERLQAARIQKGLSLDEIAERMHLSLSILKAIEDNNFEEITAPIFVKGYLRAYARIVSLNEDEMILQYHDFYSEEDPPINSTSNILPELSVGDARIKWTTYLVILVLGLLLVAWWWNREQNSEVPISLDSQSTEQRSSADAEVIDSEIEAVSEDATATMTATEAESSQVESAEPTAMEPVEPTATEPVEPAATEPVEPAATEPVEPAATEPAEVSEPPAPEPVTVEAGALESEDGALESAPAVPVEPVRLAPSGSDKLKITVKADTWADVKDTNSYQLVYDLLRAGESVELLGEAPFSVFLGNGNGVEIEFNDEAVDISRRIRDDNTARLRIGS